MDICGHLWTAAVGQDWPFQCQNGLKRKGYPNPAASYPHVVLPISCCWAFAVVCSAYSAYYTAVLGFFEYLAQRVKIVSFVSF